MGGTSVTTVSYLNRFLVDDSFLGTPLRRLTNAKISANKLVNTETPQFQASDTVFYLCLHRWSTSSPILSSRSVRKFPKPFCTHTKCVEISPLSSSVCCTATRLLHVLHGFSVRHLVLRAFVLVYVRLFRSFSRRRLVFRHDPFMRS